MKVNHVTISVSTLGGGISVVVKDLSCALARRGIDVSVRAIEDTGESLPGWADSTEAERHRAETDARNCSSGHICVRSHPISSRLLYPKSNQLLEELRSLDADLTHSHGLWTDCSAAVVKSSLAVGRPWMVSPHGMLDQWALKRSRWKKRLAKVLFEQNHLDGARCLHALSESEEASIREFGIDQPIATLPNGVELPELTDALLPGTHQDGFVDDGTRDLLFLGRVHPKKGLVGLIQAWKRALQDRARWPLAADAGPQWRLVIAGWDQDGHRDELKQGCRELGLRVRQMSVTQYLSHQRMRVPQGSPDRSSGMTSLKQDPGLAVGREDNPADVIFLDSVFGREKDLVFRRAAGFILPSFSEGLPVAILEAFSYAIPVLMTRHCNLPEGFRSGAATEIAHPNDPSLRSGEAIEICQGIGQLMEMSDDERGQVGALGRELAERQFSWSRIAAQYASLYRWICGGGDRPDFVTSGSPG